MVKPSHPSSTQKSTPKPTVVKGLDALPEALRAEVKGRWNVYRQGAAQAHLLPPHQIDFMTVLYRVWAASDFVAHSCIREPALLTDLLDSGDLLGDYAAGEMAAKATAALAGAGDDDELCDALRLLRRREMVRIAWRDLAGWAEVEEVLRDLSDLADACVSSALQRLNHWQCKEMGAPVLEDGTPQSLVVLGMGKLGARELNFSSDIDLIFAYPAPGQLRGRKGASYEEFFTRLAQRLIHALGATTAEGFVFRVDMRLRPYGESGPLVMCFDALEDYYQSQGREWERYAMIKARPIAGDPAQGAQLMAMLQPFIYRRYLDYGAFESLREMKAMIQREVQRKGQEDNIKLGIGGIREVEFIAQAFQLIRGGRQPALQERGLLKVLRQLAQLGYLPAYACERLADSYRFLRRVENRLQEHADRQTHRLPVDPLEQLRLALAMGYPDWVSFVDVLNRHRNFVDSQFQQVFEAQQTDGEEGEALQGVWAGTLEAGAACAALQVHGFDADEDEAAEALRVLEQFRTGYACRAMSPRGRQRLDRLMPLLLGAAGGTANSGATLLRLVTLLEAIAGRSAYLSLLVEHPMVLSQLVRLCAASPWIAAQIVGHPLLLDELLDARTLYAPLSHAALETQLDQRLAQVPGDDLEQQMEVMRQVKQAAVLRVAAADIMEAIPLMVVSDHLTDIAEVTLTRVLVLAWNHLLSRHGVPRCRVAGKLRDAGFAIIGYGKLGGIELGYGSDLDLVFLHDSEGDEQKTAGPNVLSNAVFFARLGQRIIHLLNTLTPSGVLYEVDMRLRPSGASGLLVSSMESFTSYQRSDAWTWEHQALVRARAVAGDARIAESFTAIRHERLSQRRDSQALRTEVRDMRERMRQELGRDRGGCFDLKQGRGGIADIEFMVQYSVLLWSHDHPELLRYTDNIRLLQGLADAGLMSGETAQLLADAYRAYRARAHQLTLLEESAAVDDGEFREQREAVAGIWDKIMQS